MTSDCGHKLTPDFHVSQRATQSCQPWVEGSHQRVLIRPPSNARWQGHAPVRMGRANQETMRQAEKERMGRRKKKSPPPHLTFSPFAGWPLTPVLSPCPDSRGQPEVRQRETCGQSVCVGAKASNRKWRRCCESRQQAWRLGGEIELGLFCLGIENIWH